MVQIAAFNQIMKFWSNKLKSKYNNRLKFQIPKPECLVTRQCFNTWGGGCTSQKYGWGGVTRDQNPYFVSVLTLNDQNKMVLMDLYLMLEVKEKQNMFQDG